MLKRFLILFLLMTGILFSCIRSDFGNELKYKFNMKEILNYSFDISRQIEKNDNEILDEIYECIVDLNSGVLRISNNINLWEYLIISELNSDPFKNQDINSQVIRAIGFPDNDSIELAILYRNFVVRVISTANFISIKKYMINEGREK